jgi:hypothetical protein
MSVAPAVAAAAAVGPGGAASPAAAAGGLAPPAALSPAAAAAPPPPAAAGETKTGGVTKDDLIRIGRPNGPDLQLKFSSGVLGFNTTTATIQDIIKSDSSITEVLNVVAFLTESGGRTFNALVDKDNSAYDGTANGAIDAPTGYYADPAAPAVDFADAIIDLARLDVAGPARDVKIPVSILKRRGAEGASDDDPNSFENMSTKQIAQASAGADAKALLSDCVKQMINLLVQTRQIFGPKGWTDLFQKVKGGASSKKRTHRRHRRRYSSKHY